MDTSDSRSLPNFRTIDCSEPFSTNSMTMYSVSAVLNDSRYSTMYGFLSSLRRSISRCSSCSWSLDSPRSATFLIATMPPVCMLSAL